LRSPADAGKAVHACIHKLQLAARRGRARGPGSADRWIRACSPATIAFMSSQWKKVAYLAVGGLTEVASLLVPCSWWSVIKAAE
jgi:hypothetical protein